MIKFLKKWIFNNQRRIPGPIYVPLLGDLWRYKLGLVKQSAYPETLDKLYHKYGNVVRQRLGSETIIHIFNPDDAITIYANEGKYPTIKPLQESIMYFRKKSKASPGLGFSNGDEWYRLRKSIKSVMLIPREIQSLIGDIETVTHKLIKKLKIESRRDNSVKRLMLLLGAWSLEGAGAACFGKRMGYLEENEREVLPILTANRSIFYYSTHLKFSTKLYKYINLPKWICLESLENYIVNETNRHTNETMEKIIENISTGDINKYPHCFLMHLIRDESVSRRDVETLIQSVFTDSLSTTVPHLVNCLYVLATEPQVQTKAYEELCKFVDKDSPINSSTLESLKYIKGVIKETFRLYPNGTDISRILHHKLELSGYTAPSESHIHINMGVHFRSSKEFKRPLEIIPERWFKDKMYNQPHPFVLTPFGHGTRSCLGRRFAEQNLQIALSRIILNFNIKYKSGVAPLEQIYNTLIFPSDTRGIIFEPRL